MTAITKSKIDDAESPWTDQTGKVITIEDCISACWLAGSVLLKELEFNPKVKENEHSKNEYERARIIINRMKENYERVLAAMPQKPKLVIPKAGLQNIVRRIK